MALRIHQGNGKRMIYSSLNIAEELIEIIQKCSKIIQERMEDMKLLLNNDKEFNGSDKSDQGNII